MKMPASWPRTHERVRATSGVAVREAATRLALVFDDPAALGRLREVAARTGAPAGERRRALEALVARRDAGLDGLLIELIGEPAVPALGDALQDEREGVRVRAAYALHKIGSRKAARWLFPALNDPNHIVHTYAYETLDQMGMLTTILVK